MTLMDWLFASGHAVDIVLAVITLEAIWLLSRGMRIADVLSLLLPGALILLALRAALVGAAWPWIAILLLASFPVHLIDLARRRGRTDA